MNAKFVLLCVSLYVCGSLGHRLSYKHVSEFVNDDAEGEHWAFLVAGSDDWQNYRHQADVCHAYQILRKHGMPAERIIVMMKDDIAFHKLNPTPGIIINEINGPDVYEGVRIDYRGEDVTPENFLAILSGKEAAMAGIGTGRVIKSDPKNHVFVNFVDHGSDNAIYFQLKPLYKDDLLNTLQQMHDEKKFGKMVMYIEACHAGTIFHDLPKDINVYATTSSNLNSSYGFCLDGYRWTVLSDEYSVNWMRDSDDAYLGDETFQTQYERVRDLTAHSHVKQWGDLTIARQTLDHFMGLVGAKVDHSFDRRPLSRDRQCVRLPPPYDQDLDLTILEQKLSMAESREEKYEIMAEIQRHTDEKRRVRDTLEKIEAKALSFETDENEEVVKSSDCYDAVYKLMTEKCYNMKKNFDVVLKLANLCQSNIPVGVIELSILETCIN